MAERRYGKATAVITAFWLLTSAAVLTLATADDTAQAGCGGSSSSPSPSGSSSSGGGGGGLPTGATTILPLPGGSSSGSGSPSGSESGSPSESGADDGIPVAQEQKCKSTITIAFESGKNPKFTGKVGSPEPNCKRARDVTVKKVKRGRDLRVGKAVTNAKGKYVVPARNGNGRFYAKVSKATVEDENGTTINCQRAKSRTIRP